MLINGVFFCCGNNFNNFVHIVCSIINQYFIVGLVCRFGTEPTHLIIKKQVDVESRYKWFYKLFICLIKKKWPSVLV